MKFIKITTTADFTINISVDKISMVGQRKVSKDCSIYPHFKEYTVITLISNQELYTHRAVDDILLEIRDLLPSEGDSI